MRLTHPIALKAERSRVAKVGRALGFGLAALGFGILALTIAVIASVQ